MCQKNPTHSTEPAEGAVRSPLPGALFSSRRVKLWELPEMFHCPVVGVCLSPKTIQRLIVRFAKDRAPSNDYDCHSIVVGACGRRGPLSELLQRELDARHSLAIQQCRSFANQTTLLAAWKAAVAKGDIAGCFWALITHPKGTPALRELIYRDVHMIQHQAGASIRVDLQAFNALGHENATLLKEMGKIQRRMSDFVQDKTAQVDKLKGDLVRRDQDIVRLKAQLDEREMENRQLSRAAGLLQQNLALQATVERLMHKLQMQADELAELRTVNRARLPASNGQNHVLDQARNDTAAMAPAVSDAESFVPRLDQKTVFVVGGRLGSFGEYRSTVEQSGARFLFHDGGLEHSMQTLDSGLQAADYVICQTGCVSHASYWRVKDYCKRTGTRCVYVESASVSSLRQSINKLHSEGAGGRGMPLDVGQ